MAGKKNKLDTSSESVANKTPRNGDNASNPSSATKEGTTEDNVAALVSPEKNDVAFKYYVVIVQGENSTESMTLNSYQEVENFQQAYPKMMRTWKAFATVEEAEKWEKQQKQATTTSGPVNNDKMKAYIRASTDSKGENTYEVDLFYDSFAKHVVMRFVLLNTKGSLFWCHKPWKVAPALSKAIKFRILVSRT